MLANVIRWDEVDVDDSARPLIVGMLRVEPTNAGSRILGWREDTRKNDLYPFVVPGAVLSAVCPRSSGSSFSAKSCGEGERGPSAERGTLQDDCARSAGLAKNIAMI